MLGPSTVLLAAVLSAMILVDLSGYYRRSLTEATVCSVLAVVGLGELATRTTILVGLDWSEVGDLNLVG